VGAGQAGTGDTRIVLRLLLAGLGGVYVIAFLSLWVQVEGLVGSGGILPNQRFFAALLSHTAATFVDAPSLCWGDGCSDATLIGLCLVGAVSGMLLVLGCAPLPAALLAWAAYLSLFYAGQAFLSFQWDLLLLEAGFLAIVAAPPRVGTPRSRAWRNSGSRVPVLLFRWLLFRLVFASGVVKLSSGDPTWRDLTALAFHYETQPIPYWTSWWVNQLPDLLQRASTAAALTIELVVPFLYFGPRELRAVGALATAGLMLLIATTGNYGFFNLLTLVLCLSLLDDAMLPARLRAFVAGSVEAAGQGGAAAMADSPLRRATLALLAAFVVATSLAPLFGAFRIQSPGWVVTAHRWQQGFRVTSPYGLFASMTTERPEIRVEGSADGRHWQAYGFPFKVDAVDRAPRFAGPHMPRLDWQLWFAALRGPERSRWFVEFARRLLEGSPEVRALLAHDPFPDAPPRHVRAVVRDYRFTDWASGFETGDWWTTGPPRLAFQLSAESLRQRAPDRER